MGLDKNNIPDEYLCEVCKPRPVDRKKARAMQARSMAAQASAIMPPGGRGEAHSADWS